MYLSLHRFILSLSGIALFAAIGLAQESFISSPSPEPAALPFSTGETLSYEGKLSKIISGITVADLTFTVLEPPAKGQMQVKAEARSKGTLLKLFRFSFLQTIESTFRPDARVFQTKKLDVQKERVRESEADFDYGELRVTYTETNPKEPMSPPRKIASEIKPETYDMVSAIYRLRMLPLQVGSLVELTVSDSGLVYRVPVKVTARERVKTIFGKVWCLKVEPDVFGPDRLIEREGSMVIWLTDDARKIPVRSLVHSPVGKVDIKLKAAKNLRS
ncbi:MAG: DUF3108 domain-containing protein [Pyrinomonadaceae bacterium]